MARDVQYLRGMRNEETTKMAKVTLPTIPVRAAKGLRFYHRRVIDPITHDSMPYTVTRVAQGIVYYRPDDGGQSECADELVFWQRVVGALRSAS